MIKKLRAPIFLGVFTVLALLLITSGGSDKELGQTFDLDAIYYDTGHVEIFFLDRSEKTQFAVLEILGMNESFQKNFTEYEFIEIVPFSTPPKYGWSAHPVVLKVEHPELGDIQIKTEIRPYGEPSAAVIYSTP